MRFFKFQQQQRIGFFFSWNVTRRQRINLARSRFCWGCRRLVMITTSRHVTQRHFWWLCARSVVYISAFNCGWDQSESQTWTRPTCAECCTGMHHSSHQVQTSLLRVCTRLEQTTTQYFIFSPQLNSIVMRRILLFLQFLLFSDDFSQSLLPISAGLYCLNALTQKLQF